MPLEEPFKKTNRSGYQDPGGERAGLDPVKEHLDPVWILSLVFD
jgi:hypothetical protein